MPPAVAGYYAVLAVLLLKTVSVGQDQLSYDDEEIYFFAKLKTEPPIFSFRAPKTGKLLATSTDFCFHKQFEPKLRI